MLQAVCVCVFSKLVIVWGSSLCPRKLWDAEPMSRVFQKRLVEDILARCRSSFLILRTLTFRNAAARALFGRLLFKRAEPPVRVVLLGDGSNAGTGNPAVMRLGFAVWLHHILKNTL